MYREPGSPVSIRWEYKSMLKRTNEVSASESKSMLNKKGSEGWELVSVAVPNPHQLLFVLKRQLM
jgi:hypothetical protein